MDVSDARHDHETMDTLLGPGDGIRVGRLAIKAQVDSPIVLKKQLDPPNSAFIPLG